MQSQSLKGKKETVSQMRTLSPFFERIYRTENSPESCVPVLSPFAANFSTEWTIRGEMLSLVLAHPRSRSFFRPSTVSFTASLMIIMTYKHRKEGRGPTKSIHERTQQQLADSEIRSALSRREWGKYARASLYFLNEKKVEMKLCNGDFNEWKKYAENPKRKSEMC